MNTLQRCGALLACLVVTFSIEAEVVRILEKPRGLVSGTLRVPIVATQPAERLALFVNGVRHAEATGREMVAEVNVGQYIRRLRLRAVGYDANGAEVGADEMMVNDPRPPFRVALSGPAEWPADGDVALHARVTAPPELPIERVDFYVGEELAGSDDAPPYGVVVDSARFPAAVYGRVVARARDGREANGVLFFGDRVHAETEVSVHQIPLSVAGSQIPLTAEDLTLLDNGQLRPIERLVPAADLPLHVILLIDYSESMLEELPLVKAAAKRFARSVLRPQDRIAVIGFHQRTFWLTGFTNDFEAAAEAIDRIQPIGETHLYDSVIEMLYELQKRSGRQALVVLTDGVDQGSRFKLDHLVHYARYAGVPIYPIVKNRSLSKWMRLGVGRVHAARLARIAEETGATWSIIQRESELDGVYERIATELRNQYQVVFHAEPDVPDQWRTLRATSRRGHALRIPRGYFP